MVSLGVCLFMLRFLSLSPSFSIFVSACLRFCFCLYISVSVCLCARSSLIFCDPNTSCSDPPFGSLPVFSEGVGA